ncbi:MAG: PEP-CTERM sorting domain-containing protein [Planctomycetota bacterium]|nr:MAG: PEP-CTERM sorting domain-containing protein [Planctomycetota bacterium]REK43507.1 MAG: PEP-CTERM sorting domain-containing protein [Planctomycetota bacterium]
MSLRHIQKICGTVLSVCLVLGMARPSDALIMIAVDDLSNGVGDEFVISDGDLADLFGTPPTPDGMVTTAQTLATGQTVSISATSIPLMGTLPKLDLVSLAIHGPTPGTLRIRATNTGFTPPATPTTDFFAAIGGTTEGSVSGMAFYDTDDTAFGTSGPNSVMTHNFGSFTDPSFDASATFTDTTPGAPFSMTLLVDIIHDDANDVTGFSFLMSATEPTGENPVPEPATIALGMIGLLVLGPFLARHRRRRRLRSG